MNKVVAYLSFTLIMMTSLLNTCSAEVFKYTDQSGQTHYVDKLEKVPVTYRDQAAKAISLPPITKVKTLPLKYEERSEPYSPAARVKQPTIEIFVTSWCGYCRKLEQYLESKKLKFSKYDIEHNSRGKSIYNELGGGGVPITRINNRKIVHGFDQAELENALNN